MSEMMYDGEFLIIDHGHPCCPHRYRVIEDDVYNGRVPSAVDLDDPEPAVAPVTGICYMSDGLERHPGNDATMPDALPASEK